MYALPRLAACLLALASASCGGARDTDAGAGDSGPFDAGAPLPVATDLDLLFLIDTSGSLTSEQQALAAQLPWLFQILATGDLDGDRVADFRPFDTVHAGVITADMGTGGFTVPTCANSSFGDDGILRTASAPAAPLWCAASYPSFIEWRASDAPEAIARPLTCLSAGTRGCGFEQPLEAVLKALSPAAANAGTAANYASPRFLGNTAGHGDRAHAGFVRDDSLLAIVVFSDEDDCSARDPELFNRDSAAYNADLNLRCFAFAGEALHPLDRYVDGLLQLRRSPDRLAFMPIVGIPRDLEPGPGQPIDFPPLIGADLSVRDDRMRQRVDPASPTRLFPSCNEADTGLAFPPLRIVRVASMLEERGARVGLASICTSDLADAVEVLARTLRR